jgi:FkbM family methyltransferase
MSNSYLLETDFGWRGILSEPAHIWHHNLKNNRTAIIDFRCIWSKTGEYIKFNEVDEAGLSTINLYTNVDCHSNERLNGELYDVPTISLMDLLIEHSAPSEIDYLSIDTEGSEYDILSSIDFSKYKFKIITCEHNYSPNRELIYDLLTKNGYVRFLTEESQFDDWYFFPNLFTASK